MSKWALILVSAALAVALWSAMRPTETRMAPVELVPAPRPTYTWQQPFDKPPPPTPAPAFEYSKPLRP